MPEQETSAESIVEQMLSELESGSGGSSIGPSKSITGVSISYLFENLSGDHLRAVLSIHASHEGLHADTWDAERDFNVTLRDIEGLSRVTKKMAGPIMEIIDEYRVKSAEWDDLKARKQAAFLKRHRHRFKKNTFNK